MDLSLALDLVHALSAILWLFGGVVLALILLVAGRDAEAGLRAVAEARLIGHRVLRPASLATLATGLLLAVPAGLLLEAWVLLASALTAATLVARTRVLEPACERALAAREPRPALALAGLDLGAQASVLALMVLRPGWIETLILAGLLACLALAAGLLRSLNDLAPLPS